MDFRAILDLIPDDYELLVAVLVLVVYYGFPRFKDWRSHKRFFDARTRVLEYKKLLYEVESIKKQNELGDVADAGLKDLMALADELKPKTKVLPPIKRFFYGWGGSAVAFTVFAIFYFAFVPTDEAFMFVLGAMVLSFVAGAPTVLYRSDKAYKSALFGGGAGFIIAFVIGLFA